LCNDIQTVWNRSLLLDHPEKPLLMAKQLFAHAAILKPQ
jgi:hypothetical protein